MTAEFAKKKKKMANRVMFISFVIEKCLLVARVIMTMLSCVTLCYQRIDFETRKMDIKIDLRLSYVTFNDNLFKWLFKVNSFKNTLNSFA